MIWDYALIDDTGTLQYNLGTKRFRTINYVPLDALGDPVYAIVTERLCV
jgi:hypothetical protein